MFNLFGSEGWRDGTYHLREDGSISFLEVDEKRYFKDQGQIPEVTPQMEAWLMEEAGKALSKIKETFPGLGGHQLSFSLFNEEDVSLPEAYLSFLFVNFLEFPEVTSGWMEIRVTYR